MSIPLGRLFGITIRIHWLFPFVALGWILHVAFYKPYEKFVIPEGAWIDAAIFMLILFVSVLLHELGHCFTARATGGDAHEVLMWPLGGLASVELPNRPQSHLLTAAAGPAVNILLAVTSGLLLLVASDEAVQPVWNPMPSGFAYRMGKPDGVKVEREAPAEGLVKVQTWSHGTKDLSPYSLPVWLVRICWVNYFLAALNLVLVGFPLDGGRILQAALWPSMGYRQSMLTAVFAGFGVVFIVGLYSIIQASVLALGLALFIYVACQRQWLILETGGEEGAFGYDFSQGYTSLDRDQVQAAPTSRPRVSWWRRWMQRRTARRIQRENERREADDRRLDELLEKVHRHGQESLNDEEKRFMKRVSDRFKNRKE